MSLRHLLLGRKILIVDDNNVNLKVAAAGLKRYGAAVVCVERGKKATELLTPPHQFDACFMDIQMPEMDGYEMLPCFESFLLIGILVWKLNLKISWKRSYKLLNRKIVIIWPEALNC